MKCPYRLVTHKKIYTEVYASDTAKIIKEQTDFEDCYCELCPFYIDNYAFREPICGRVYNEVGGEL